MAGKILKFLPKAASFSIPNHNNNSNNRSKHKYTFSGPIIAPMIPEHCRRKRYGMLEEEEEEPTSPKVSCIGQVNHHSKKKSDSKKKKKKVLVTKQELEDQQQHKKKKEEAPKRSTSSIGRMFWRKAAKPAAARREVVDESSDDEALGAPAAAGIGRMRRFASGRVEALKDFDWRTIVDQDEVEKEEEQLVPHSAPILVGGGAVALEPKKEMNIWMRRTRTPPVPLQVT